MATLTTQKIARAGVAPTFAAAAVGGDRFTPGHYTYLEIKNAGGSPVTVTVAATAKVDNDIALANTTVSVPATTGDIKIGPFPPRDYLATDGSGLADITYSGVTSVTIGVFSLSQP